MKIRVYKLNQDFKIFKKGTIFEEIEEMFVVKNEFARCMERAFFTDQKKNITFDKIMEKFGTMDITETLYFQYNIRSFDNQVKFLKEKLDTVVKTREDFLKKFKK